MSSHFYQPEREMRRWDEQSCYEMMIDFASLHALIKLILEKDNLLYIDAAIVKLLSQAFILYAQLELVRHDGSGHPSFHLRLIKSEFLI